MISSVVRSLKSSRCPPRRRTRSAAGSAAWAQSSDGLVNASASIFAHAASRRVNVADMRQVLRLRAGPDGVKRSQVDNKSP